MLAAETVRVPVLEFFKVTVWLPVVFTVTLPNATGDGVTVSCGADVSMPVPLSGTEVVVAAELLVSEMLPLIAAPDGGKNEVTNVLLCPPARLNGSARFENVKPAPVTVAAEIVSIPAPEFCNVTTFEPWVPTVTLPKATGEGFTVS